MFHLSIVWEAQSETSTIWGCLNFHPSKYLTFFDALWISIEKPWLLSHGFAVIFMAMACSLATLPLLTFTRRSGSFFTTTSSVDAEAEPSAEVKRCSSMEPSPRQQLLSCFTLVKDPGSRPDKTAGMENYGVYVVYVVYVFFLSCPIILKKYLPYHGNSLYMWMP